ncbi:MAG: DUF1194 domain-containing protein [Alphaproteobacteria bacterium]|nr:DUF1194 domain-containing protein [Alphaproteobacteria bacterium]
MHSRRTVAFAALTLIGLTGTAEAIPVDLELSLVIDSSGSIDDGEFSQQIDGYAQAFQQAAVISSIVNAPNGIAVNTILFASNAAEVIPFQHLQTEQNILDFAAALAAIARDTGGTNIAAGLNLAQETLNTNDFTSGNVIIDVSGDGEQNTSGDPALSRDAALSAGVSRINGIAIGDQDVFDFYQANVIGGADAFILQADSFADFDAAIARKVQLEVGAPDPDPAPTPVAAPGALGLIGFGVFALGWIMRRRPLA